MNNIAFLDCIAFYLKLLQAICRQLGLLNDAFIMIQVNDTIGV